MTRKVNFNGYLLKVSPMMLIWGTMIHEYGHLMALRLFGGHGYIKSEALNLTWMTNGLTGLPLTVFYMAGGLTQALYGCYNMISESDDETWLSGFSVTCQGLTYMWFEEPRLFALGALLSVCFTALAIIYLNVLEIIEFD